MPIIRSQQIDWEERNHEIAARLCQVREGLKLTQSQFGYELGFTRERLASYEDGRTPLKCELALRICRYFFVSEFWLATGSTDAKAEAAGQKSAFPGQGNAARMTMALGAERIALSLPPGILFGQGFQTYLRTEYLKLAEIDMFPRIVPLMNDSPGYLNNAAMCMLACWNSALVPDNWNEFFAALIKAGNVLFWEFQGTGSKSRKLRKALEKERLSR